MEFSVFTPKKAYPLSGFGGRVLGHEYAVTNRYLTRDGKPFVYRMGELHFSRVPRKDWEQELIKMREGGIEIVASYLFWIHHEETEGKFDFTDNRDLSAFCEVCKRVGLPFFLRIGPWAHGEARNGGFPDWLLEKCGGKDHTRTNEQPYLDCVKRYFERIFQEVQDHSDVIIGIQVENELHRNAPHMETLRQMIYDLGFRAPIWTATGWGPAGSGAHIPTNGKLLPAYGAYPEAPWAAHTDPILGSQAFHFSNDWNTAGIGTDIFEDASSNDETQFDPSHKNPYLTCEVGGGNQVTYHRRPILSADDVASCALCRLGSGACGIGYYMYHGGRNPIGKTTMQESRKSGYKNDYAIVSYDFQAPIGECGQLRRSYFTLLSLHRFLDCCGEQLAAMPCYLPNEMPSDLFDRSVLRCAVRSDGERGFLFFNNHAHGEQMQDLSESITIKLAEDNQEIKIPLSVPANTYGIIPFRFPIGTELAEWITAMPISIEENEILFEKIKGIDAKICLSNGTVIDLSTPCTISGVKVSLAAPTEQKRSSSEPLSIRKTDPTINDKVFSHIENRDGSAIETAKTETYLISLTGEEEFLSIEAKGNVAAIFYGDHLLSDQYLYGDEWIVDVREIQRPAELILKILPLTEENRRNIYFETEMPIGAVAPIVRPIKELSKETVYGIQN
jgi:hypothetical protein